MIIRSLSKDDGNGSENGTQKVNSRSFKLHRSYSNTFNLSMLAIFFRSWILNCLSSEKEQGNCCLMLTFSIEREIRKFHVVFVLWRQRNVQKSTVHVQSCCFANLNLLLFCRSCCRCRGRCLSSLLPNLGYFIFEIIDLIDVICTCHCLTPLYLRSTKPNNICLRHLNDV